MYGCNQWIKNKAWKLIASPSPVQVRNSWASFGEKRKWMKNIYFMLLMLLLLFDFCDGFSLIKFLYFV